MSISEGSKGYLLVVDDNEMNCDMLSRRLERRGYSVKIALNGYQALELLNKEAFDIVLLDIMMPGISGIDVLRKIRDVFSLTDLPVLMTTAKRDNESVVEALKLGANDYLTKPFDFQVVLARIETQLSIKSQVRRRSTSGLFKVKISGVDSPDELTAKLFCPSCQTALMSNQAECPKCHVPRPAIGWPRIADSDLTYLGQVIGSRYFLEQYLSSGTTGEVYRCRDLELSRIFAAKIIDASQDESGLKPEELRSRIKMEVEAMVRLQNPHVVKIYEVLQVRPNVFALVMDFVRGQNVGDLLEQYGPFDPVSALRIVRQAAQGLFEAHQLGMIHRDMKPDNIMVEKLPAGGYFAQVLDFGIVYLLDRPTSGDRYFGTPLYTSPEQVQQGVKVDHRADIYGLGAVLFHMLCGRPPFESEDVMEILSAHMSAAVPRLRAILVEQPGVEILEALIDKMLAKNRDERFQTLREVIERIDEVLPIVSYTPGASPLRPTTAITLPPAASRTLDLPSAEALATIADRTLWPDRFPALLHAEPGTLPPLLDGTDRALLAVQRDTTATLLRIGFKKQAVEPVLELPDEQLSAFGLSPCTRFLVIADVGAQRVRVLGTRSHQELSSWNLPEREITCLAVSDEGRLIAAGTSSGSLYVIDNWGVEAPLLISKGKPLRAMAFTPDENELAIAREGSHFELLAISEEGANGALLNLESDVAAIAFDPDGLLGAVVTAHFNIHAFSYNEQLLECGSAQVANVVALAFGDDHALTGLSARDGRYRLLDLKGIVKDPTRSVAQGA